MLTAPGWDAAPGLRHGFLDRDDSVVVTGPPPVVFAHPSFQRQFGALEIHHGG